MNDNTKADSIKLTGKQYEFDLKAHPKIVDFEIVYEISDTLAADIRNVIDERAISSLQGKVPQHPQKVRQPPPYFRKTK